MGDPTRACERCGCSLAGRRTNVRYCSTACRVGASEDRARADGRYQQWRAATASRKPAPPAYEKDCPECGQHFTAKRDAKVYCSRPCGNRAFNRVRIADGRLRVQRKEQHATRRAYQQKHKGRWDKVQTCGACGETVVKPNHGRKVSCSALCHHYLVHGAWPLTVLPFTHPIYSSPVPETHPSRAGRCRRCNEPFVVRYVKQHYCTRVCAARASVARRGARKRGAYVADVSPQYIYDRDQWRCHLCRKALKRKAVVPDPLAPTLDHVIPLARGGTHEPANVRAAHFICNSMKSDHGGGEQLLLLG